MTHALIEPAGQQRPRPEPARYTGDDTQPLAMPRTAITLYDPPRGWQPSPEVAETIAWLKAEVRHLERGNRAHLIAAGAARRASGEPIPAGSVYARISRKAAGMIREPQPPWEPAPVPASLRELWHASMDSGA